MVSRLNLTCLLLLLAFILSFFGQLVLVLLLQKGLDQGVGCLSDLLFVHLI